MSNRNLFFFNKGFSAKRHAFLQRNSFFLFQAVFLISSAVSKTAFGSCPKELKDPTYLLFNADSNCQMSSGKGCSSQGIDSELAAAWATKCGDSVQSKVVSEKPPVSKVAAPPKESLPNAPSEAAYEANGGASKLKIEQNKNNLGIESLDEFRSQTVSDASLRGVSLSRNLPSDPRARAALVSDLELVHKARETLVKNERFPRSLARQANDEIIRSNLLLTSGSYEARERLKYENGRIGAQLVELLKMASLNNNNSSLLNSIEKVQTKFGDRLSPNKEEVSARDRSPASSKDQSNVVVDGEIKNEEYEDENLEKRQKNKIEEALAAAEKRKKSISLRRRLRAEIAKQQGKEESLDTDQLFGGQLSGGLKVGLNEAIDDSNIEKAGRESGSSAQSIFQDAMSRFSLAGEQTDEEIRRILDETQRELGAEDVQAGILGTETLSLFERIKAAIGNCVKQKCVRSRQN